MTAYIYGRTDRQHRARRRRLTLLLGVALAVGLAFGVRALAASLSDAASPSDAAAPHPAATALSDELVRRFDEAARAAASEGLELQITSGWRSADEQEQLIAEAVATYGSEAEAHRWVLPPEKSAHVQGLAIDVGPPAGAAWLDENGAAFGLCSTYANEAWHFEPVIEPGGVCPEPSADSSLGW